ncbi:MAG TPA: hypothetical protein VGC79_29660 [Polyangiaceae bacterium]
MILLGNELQNAGMLLLFDYPQLIEAFQVVVARQARLSSLCYLASCRSFDLCCYDDRWSKIVRYVCVCQRIA